ncbi:hypothetical protein TNCV_1921631 [Trichonephila clavipes]|nr:hypothetical protein TNCV_1921631 [Trichonephila clavipes]
MEDDRYQSTLSPQGGGWRKGSGRTRTKPKSDVTRARGEERRKGGLNSPKRVRGTPKRSGRKECCKRSRYEKRRESASRTFKRNSRWIEAGASSKH